MALAAHVTKSKATTFFIDENCLRRRSRWRARAPSRSAGPLLSRPVQGSQARRGFWRAVPISGVTGVCHDFSGVIASLHDAKAIAVVAADPLALTLLKSPGEMGADVAVGSMQRFGMPMGYGGPHAGYIAVKDAYKRALPGRLVGVSVDSRGNRAIASRCKRANSISSRERHL